MPGGHSAASNGAAPGGGLRNVALLLKRDPVLRERSTRAMRWCLGKLKMIEFSPGGRGIPPITVRTVSSAGEDGGPDVASEKPSAMSLASPSAH